jgi:hypothetical protein
VEVVREQDIDRLRAITDHGAIERVVLDLAVPAIGCLLPPAELAWDDPA